MQPVQTTDDLAKTGGGGAVHPARAQSIYQRLWLVAQLLRDAPPGEGPRLLWRNASGNVEVRVIDRDLLIGRDPACDIVFNVTKVSRRHSRVLCHGGHILLQDLDSTHGSLVNGEAEKQSVLADGDLLELGGVLLVYSFG
jgi:pSer/pThr/pTyr-binding forkhead associated (FHA) protein